MPHNNSKQTLLEKLYDIDNVVTVSVTMVPEEWAALLAARPKGEFGFREFQPKKNKPDEMEKVGRYDWQKAMFVTILGTKFPTSPLTFTDVGIIKKSFAGSFSNVKPSFRLNFTKWNNDQEKAVESSLGLKHLTLNNSKQDDSYVRQTIGYDIFRQAGLPYPRCNFAKVIVNGQDYGAYINLEPMKKAFLERNFDNTHGNLYEIEHGEDLVEGSQHMDPLKGISFEGNGPFSDLADLRAAAAVLNMTKTPNNTFPSASQAIDMDNFLRYFSLEILLKHFDGYALNTNNTYLYNDVVAVKNPTVAAGNVRLKFIPSGIDQILLDEKPFAAGIDGVVAYLVLDEAPAAAKLRETIRSLAETVFSPANVGGKILPLVKKMEDLVNTVAKKPSDPSVTEPVAIVRKQLRIARAGAYQLLDELPPTLGEGLVLRGRATGAVIEASSESGTVHQAGLSGTPAQKWEIMAMPESVNNAAVKVVEKQKVVIKNKAYGTYLHVDKSAPGTKVCAVKEEGSAGNGFVLAPTAYLPWTGSSGRKMTATGYCWLQSAETGQSVALVEGGVTLVDGTSGATEFYLH